MGCPYANLLGVPGEGVHERIIFGYARNDIIATILVAIITSYYYNISFILSFVVWFTLGEILHILFGTQTAFLDMIGLRPQCK